MPFVRCLLRGKRAGEVKLDTIFGLSNAKIYTVLPSLAYALPALSQSSLFPFKFINLGAGKVHTGVLFAKIKYYQNGDRYIKKGLLIAPYKYFLKKNERS
jgi:hypothetical protein